ncbi:MAG: hypothetical protein HXY40_15515 [Chloroflexi bacterium]|nr:hypothetical protein [Chloroflexota bacterium]
MNFPIGSVGHSLTQMRGVWHDHVEIFDLAGSPLAEDAHSGTPGAAPFDNLVYIDFDGERYLQTNVTFRGRPLHVRTFSGLLRAGILEFDPLGPQDPGHIGVSGGPGVLFFVARAVSEAWQRYNEPDCIRLLSAATRTRTTVLYRNGVAVRTLTANGHKLAPTAARRLPDDPRGLDGPVHEQSPQTRVFEQKTRSDLPQK